MNVTEKLMDEHQLILKYIDLLKRYLSVLSRDPSRSDLFSQLPQFIDFIQNYSDRYHHAKEENILFKYMEMPGVLTHCNPLPVMLDEHDSGRSFVKQIKEAIDANDHKKMIECALGWARLLQDHINKEDNVLYLMAEEGLDEEQKKMIIKEYDLVEQSMNGIDLDHKYVEQYHYLCGLLG